MCFISSGTVLQFFKGRKSLWKSVTGELYICFSLHLTRQYSKFKLKMTLKHPCGSEWRKRSVIINVIKRLTSFLCSPLPGRKMLNIKNFTGFSPLVKTYVTLADLLLHESNASLASLLTCSTVFYSHCEKTSPMVKTGEIGFFFRTHLIFFRIFIHDIFRI